MNEQQARGYAQDANVRAFLRAIRAGESHPDLDEAYTALFGWKPGNGQVFNDFTAHPNVRTYETHDGQFIKNGKIDFTTAAGAYQIVKTTWDGLQRKYPWLRTFSPDSQDLAAICLIHDRGALSDVLDGRIVQAIGKLGDEWASLPSATVGQPTVALGRVLGVYTRHGGHLAGEAATPVPPTPEKRQEAPMPAPPRPDAEPYAAAPAPQQEKPTMATPALPLVLSLAGSLIDWFRPLIKEKVSKEMDRHVGNPEISGQLAENLIEAAKRATGKADPIEAVAAARADPAAMAQVEESALEHLQRMAPLLDKLQSMDRERWAADEASRDAASRRAAGDPNDQDPFLTRSLVSIQVGLLISVVLLMCVLAWLKVDGNIIAGLAALFTTLATGVNNKFGTRIDHRYGSSSGSVAKDTVIHELSRDRK
jgi:muramidase (phage lysozyme)